MLKIYNNSSNNPFRSQLEPYERECRKWMETAREIREQNNETPTQEEFAALSEAVKIRTKIRNLCEGETRKMQDDKIGEINRRREEIVAYLDPDYINTIEARRAAAEKPADAKAENTVPGNQDSSQTADGISEKEVKNWFVEKPKYGFADVAGMKNLVERLSNCALGAQWNLVKARLKMPTVYTYFFYGLPGCGKTFIANAFAHELMNENYSYMTLTGGKIMSSKVGVAEKTIERVFAEAKKHAPCILFIDEIDGVCADRNDDNTPQYARSLTTAFLNGYNSLKDFEGKVIFIAATNYPELVDTAMLDRAELIYVEIPDLEARCHAFELKFKEIINLEDGFSYMEMAERTESYNYRDIDRLVEHMKDKIFSGLRSTFSAEMEALEALNTDSYRLTRAMFEEAFDAYAPTPKDKEKELMQKWREKVAR